MEKEIDDYRYRWTVTIPVTCSTQLKLVIPIRTKPYSFLLYCLSQWVLFYVFMYYFPYQMVLTLSQLPQKWNRAYYLYSDPDETFSVELVIVLTCSGEPTDNHWMLIWTVSDGNDPIVRRVHRSSSRTTWRLWPLPSLWLGPSHHHADDLTNPFQSTR